MTAFWGNDTAFAPGLLGSGFDDVVFDLLTWVNGDSTLFVGSAGALDTSKAAVAVPEAQTATGRPALSFMNGRLVVAWSGTDAAATLNLAVAAQLDGHAPASFEQKAILWGHGAPAGPAMTWGNDRLYLVWADEHGRLQLGWSADPLNPDGWSFLELPETAIDAPSVSVSSVGDTTVWIAWTGTDHNNTVNVASGFTPGQEALYRKTTLGVHPGSFFPDTPTRFVGSSTSPAGPSIAVYLNRFRLAYTGPNKIIYVLSNHAGDVSRYQCKASSDAGPAVIIGGGLTAVAWRGLDGGHTLNLSSADLFINPGATLDNNPGERPRRPLQPALH
jgi:hypothetical protein